MHQPIKAPKVDPKLPKGTALNQEQARKGSADSPHNGSHSK